MKPCLTRHQHRLWHVVAGEVIAGAPASVSGDVSGLRGDVSGLRGDVSGLRGDVSAGLRGDVSDLWGYVTGLSGNVTGLSGDVSGLWGNVSEAGITDEDREKGVCILALEIPADSKTPAQPTTASRQPTLAA